MTRRATAPHVLLRDEGEHRHFLNHLATTKVSSGASRSMAVIEFVAPLGFGPPLHCHHDEDEVMIILDGEIAISSGGANTLATAGSTAYLPHGVPHTFQVLSDTARFSIVTASAEGRPRFEQVVAELGTPTADPVLPEPAHIDPTRVAAVCQANGIDVLGPPPTPLQHPPRTTTGEAR